MARAVAMPVPAAAGEVRGPPRRSDRGDLERSPSGADAAGARTTAMVPWSIGCCWARRTGPAEKAAPLVQAGAFGSDDDVKNRTEGSTEYGPPSTDGYSNGRMEPCSSDR